MSTAMGAGARTFAASWMAGDSAVLQLFDQVEHAPSPARVEALPLTPPEILDALSAEPANQRPAARAALDRLAKGAAVVVTGQQASLLGGPLYTFHKALSAVCVAEALSQRGRPVVAVFWVQDEDHDFDEMAELAWIEDAGRLRHARFPDRAPRVPVGDRAVPEEVKAGVREVLASLGKAPFLEDAAALARPWLEHDGWSDAFCAHLSAAFSDLPLLVLRGRATAASEAARALHRAALTDREAIEAALQAGTRSVEALGFAPQIAPQPGRALSFLQAGRAAPRHRLAACGGDLYQTPDGRYSSHELVALTETEPFRFTTSALLRPLLQDRVLPVAVQLAGPGEAAYLAQLGPLRDRLGVPRTAVAPRGRATWIEAWVRRRLDALGAQPAECGASPTEWLARTAKLRPELAPDALEGQLWSPFADALQALSLDDPGLDRARQRTLRSVRRNVERFIGRAARVRAEADAVRSRRFGEARSRLFPLGQPQERLLGLTDLVARHGRSRLIARFREAYVPFSADLLELDL